MKFNDGSMRRIFPENVYSDEDNVINRLKIQAKRGLIKYQKDHNITDVM